VKPKAPDPVQDSRKDAMVQPKAPERWYEDSRVVHLVDTLHMPLMLCTLAAMRLHAIEKRVAVPWLQSRQLLLEGAVKVRRPHAA